MRNYFLSCIYWISISFSFSFAVFKMAPFIDAKNMLEKLEVCNWLYVVLRTKLHDLHDCLGTLLTMTKWRYSHVVYGSMCAARFSAICTLHPFSIVKVTKFDKQFNVEESRKIKRRAIYNILRTGGNRSEGQSEIAPKQEVRLRRLPTSPFNNNYWLVHPTSRLTTASDLRS